MYHTLSEPGFGNSPRVSSPASAAAVVSGPVAAGGGDPAREPPPFAGRDADPERDTADRRRAPGWPCYTPLT